MDFLMTSLPRNAESGGTDHLTAEELAAYLSGPAALAERARLEAHLLACDQCRVEVVSARRSIRIQDRSHWLAVGSTLAVAGLAAMLLVGPSLRDVPPPGMEPPLRDGAPLTEEGIVGISIRTPGEGAAVELDRLHFSWVAIPGEVLYVVTVVDADGDVIWEQRTLEPSARWPRGESISSGASLFWFVDALVDGERSATSGVHRFEIR
jgi:hypothetical protein